MSAHTFLYDEKLDFVSYNYFPRLFLCVYFVPRSGSNLLADLMRQTKKMGFPLEYFSPSNYKYLSSRISGLSLTNLDPLFCKRTSKNGIFSYKWNSDFDALPTEYKVIRRFTPAKNLFIDRRNLDAQAKSYVTALKTGIWARQKNTIYDTEKCAVSSNEMDQAISKLSTIRNQTLQRLKNEENGYVSIYAEDLFEHPSRVLEEVMLYCQIGTDGLMLPSAAKYTSSC